MDHEEIWYEMKAADSPPLRLNYVKLKCMDSCCRFAPVPIQLPANRLGKGMQDCSNVLVPASHLGELLEIPGFWLHPGPVYCQPSGTCTRRWNISLFFPIFL